MYQTKQIFYSFLGIFCILLSTAQAEDIGMERAVLDAVCQEIAADGGDAPSLCGAAGFCSDNGWQRPGQNVYSEQVCEYACDDIQAKARCAQKIIDDFGLTGSVSCSGWCIFNSCNIVGVLGRDGVDIDKINLGNGKCAYQYNTQSGRRGELKAACDCKSLSAGE